LKSTETYSAPEGCHDDGVNFSNFGSLKSTETPHLSAVTKSSGYFSNFGSLKSTETTMRRLPQRVRLLHFSNFGSLKSTETS